MFAFAISVTFAQTSVKLQGNVLTSVNSGKVSSDTSVTRNSKITEMVFTLKDGATLPVYVSVPGDRYYVVRISKETGKPYRQYLKIAE